MRIANAQAYIFDGESNHENEGLLPAANAFAKALNCLQPTQREGQPTACNACISCRVFASGNHPDTLYITGTKANSIGVDDVRTQLVEQMATKPFSYAYKIFIIDKAETLTPQAQNALLKTIEEPAPYGVFLLLTPDYNALLETVRSRCVRVRAGENKQHTADTSTQELIKEIIAAAPQADILGALALYKKFEPFKESKESTAALLDMLYEGFGAVVRTSRAPYAFRAVKAITQTKEILSQNGNFQLAIELLLLRIGGHAA